MMKILAIVLLFNCSIVVGQNKLNIVPAPVEVKMGKGFSVLKEPISFMLTNLEDSEPNDGEALFEQYLKTNYGIKRFQYRGKPDINLATQITFTGVSTQEEKGYYELEIKNNNINIRL